jgi:hypothetical protein
MADTPRTRAQLIALFADNVTGQISAQDLRDFLVTVMNAEFVNPGDFWKEPNHQQMTSDTVRGWIDYSQLISEAVSFGNVLTRGASGQWVLASGVIGSAVSDKPLTLGIACDSYAISTFGNILRRGLIYHSAFSASFAAGIGWPVYLVSAVGGGAPGSITLNSQTSCIILGFVEPEQSTGLENDTNIWRFDPSYGWGIVAN